MNLIPKRNHTSGYWFDPFKELDKLHQDVDSLFNWSIADGVNGENGASSRAWTPLIDYNEDESNIEIKADLPGIDKKNIEVNVRDGVLTIKGERKGEEKSSKNGARVIERYSGQYFRQISLPVAVDEAKIIAEYRDGVLRLTLPKKEELKPKQIKVDVK